MVEKGEQPGYIVGLARGLRKAQTSAEERLWYCLRDRRLIGAKFRRQHPLGRYIADFYCHEARLVIELEGGIHDERNQKDYDAVRQETIEQRGLIMLRLKNEQVINDLQGTLECICAELSAPHPKGEGWP
jgi:very-short-patch-repair endonuclease